MLTIMRSLCISLCFAILMSINTGGGLAAQTEIELAQILRADHDAYLKAMEDLETRTSRGELGSAEIADYSNWIEQLGEKISRNCLALEKMSTKAVPDDLPCSRMEKSIPGPANIDIAGEKTVSEKTDNMVDELHSALGEFDEQLLKEQDKIKAQTPRSDAASNYSDARQGAGEQGEPGNESVNHQDSTAGQSDKVVTTKSAPNEQTDGENSDNGKTPGNRAQTSIPDDIPDGSDDDVVARQLREAAEKETEYLTKPQIEKKIRDTRKAMEKSAKDLDFMMAAKLRDKIKSLQSQLEKVKQ